MRALSAWLIALGGTAAVTLLGRVVHVNPSTAGFALLIVVLLSSLRGGFVVGIASSIVATLAYNFFFFAPVHTFAIAEPANWIALAAFLITSVIVSRLVIAARLQAAEAEQRRNELETLYQLGLDLFAASRGAGALIEASRRALRLLGGRDAELILSATPSDDVPREVETPLGRDVYLPLKVSGEAAGTLIARATPASMAALISASRLIALALERERFIEESAHVEALRESETLKTSLLRALSHDLTTPLTAITLQTEALRRQAADDAEIRRAVAGITDETGRLRRRIDNLLSIARLEAGKARPRREPTPPADLFRAARENMPIVFESRPMKLRVADDCPDADVDPSLTLEILVNLIENAHRVSPPHAPIELFAGPHPSAAQVRIEVLDRGPGMPEAPDVAQRGLGLEIARALAGVHGGSISFASRDGGGTIVRVDLPAAPAPLLAESK